MAKKLLTIIALCGAASLALANQAPNQVEYFKNGFIMQSEVKGKKVIFERTRELLPHDRLYIAKGENSITIQDYGIDGKVDYIEVNDHSFRNPSEGVPAADLGTLGLSEEQYRALFKKADETLANYKKIFNVEEVEKKANYKKLADIARELME